MMKATTFFGPSASVASVATRLESTPPLRPRTTRSKPTLRTSLRMKPTRIPRTSSGLIRRGGKAGSERLAGALMPDPSQLVDGQLDPLVAQQGVGEPLAADVPKIDVGKDERLVGVFLLRDDVAVRPDHHGAAPEICAILVAHAVAVEKEGREELGIGAAEGAVRLRSSEAPVGCDPTAGARGRTDDHVHPFQAQDVGAGEVPDVLADQDPCPAEFRLETAEAVPRGEIASLVEHAIGREVHLAVHVDQFAAAEVETGVEVAMVRLFDDRSEGDVQVGGQAAQFIHHGAFQRDRALWDQVFEEIAGKTELGENQQFDAGLTRLPHPLAMALEVASPVAKGRVHLCQPDREPAVPTHVTTRLVRSGLRDCVTSRPRTSHCAMAGAISSQWPRCTAARGRASRNAVP